MKKVKTNQLKIVIFTAIKYRCRLHGRVFVMIADNYGAYMFKHSLAPIDACIR